MSPVTRKDGPPSSTRSSRSASSKFLTFSLGNETFGIEILKVRGIIRVPEITPVPQMPSYIKGVINLRGKVIPVIDLRVKFGFAKAEFHDRTCLIVVCVQIPSAETVMMCLVVDVVEEVINITPQNIEATPNFGAVVDTDYMLGMAKVKNSVVTILNIDRIVASDVLQSVPAVRDSAAEQNRSTPS